MKVGRLVDGAVRVEDAAPLAPGPGEVIVRLAACGVCGTDLEKLRGRYQSGGKIGHEPVGVVRSIGEGVTGLAEGDRVFVHHHVACGVCPVCQRGEPTFCPTYSRTNLDPGGFSEEFRVPAENVSKGSILRLDPAVSWDVGALLEPAGCALTALRRVGFRAGDSVFVVGLGPVGLLYARLAAALGARWVGGAELSPRRRDAATSGGISAVVDPREPDAAPQAVAAATRDTGVDLAVVATGAPPAIALGYRLARRGGTLNLFGLPDPGSRLDVDLQTLYLHGTRVVPTYATTEREIADVHRMVARGQLHLDDLVTDRFPLSEVAVAFARAAEPDRSVKVVVTGPSYG